MRTAKGRIGLALRTPMGVTASILVILVLSLAVVAPILWTEEANTINTDQILAPPSADHWLGTDYLGRDLFFRVLVASRLSVGLALAVTCVGLVGGIILGAAPFFLPRRLGRLVTSFVNITVAFPGLLLALFLAVVFGVGPTGVVLALGFAGAPSFARLCHTMIAAIASRDFMTAARIVGVGRTRMLRRHVLPNIGEPLIVNTTIAAASALLAVAGLSFLGLGIQPPSYDWGSLLQDGLTRIFVQPMAALGPGFAIVVAGLAISLFGEAMARGLGVEATITAAFLKIGSQPSALHPPEEDQPDPSAQTLANAEDGKATVLEVENMSVAIATAQGWIHPVRNVTFTVSAGESVGIVGESGAGKSLTAMAVASLVEAPDVVTADRLAFLGVDLIRASEADLRHHLGTSMAVVFQDPLSSLNPTQRIGTQLAEVSRIHAGLNRRAARERAVDKLREVQIPQPAQRVRQYPHEFSGGMRQRAMIAMGLMESPALIIADEPTTALDATVQRQVLDLLGRIRQEEDAAILIISHDITVLHAICDRILVMYAGRIVEDLSASELRTPLHPYTRALIDVVPGMDSDPDRPLTTIPGVPVEPTSIPDGCPFAPRCPLADDRCRAEDPDLVWVGGGRRVACWNSDRVAAQTGAATEEKP